MTSSKSAVSYGTVLSRPLCCSTSSFSSWRSSSEFARCRTVHCAVAPSASPSAPPPSEPACERAPKSSGGDGVSPSARARMRTAVSAAGSGAPRRSRAGRSGEARARWRAQPSQPSAGPRHVVQLHRDVATSGWTQSPHWRTCWRTRWRSARSTARVRRRALRVKPRRKRFALTRSQGRTKDESSFPTRRTKQKPGRRTNKT